MKTRLRIGLAHNCPKFRSDAVPFHQPNVQMSPFSTVNRYPKIRPFSTTNICNKCGRIDETVLGSILALLLEMRVGNNHSPVSQFFILLRNFPHFSRNNRKYLQPSRTVVAMRTLNQFNSYIFILFQKTIVHNESFYMNIYRIDSTPYRQIKQSKSENRFRKSTFAIITTYHTMDSKINNVFYHP